MNVPTNWTEHRVNWNEVVYRSEHTFGGRREVRARILPTPEGEDVIVWDGLNDAPHFIVERAKEALGWKD